MYRKAQLSLLLHVHLVDLSRSGFHPAGLHTVAYGVDRRMAHRLLRPEGRRGHYLRGLVHFRPLFRGDSTPATYIPCGSGEDDL